MNKVLVVIYVGIKDLNPGQVQEYFSKIYENLPSKEEGFFSFVLPDKESDSIKVECLNPVLLDESEYAKAKEKLDRLNEKIKSDYNI
jgi:hypothetical protein